MPGIEEVDAVSPVAGGELGDAPDLVVPDDGMLHAVEVDAEKRLVEEIIRDDGSGRRELDGRGIGEGFLAASRHVQAADPAVRGAHEDHVPGASAVEGRHPFAD
ncbi:hypothetical protein D3C86_1852300 [compost metagenome]